MPFQAILGSLYISAKVLFITQFPILKLLIQHNYPLKVEVVLGSLHILIIVVTIFFLTCYSACLTSFGLQPLTFAGFGLACHIGVKANLPTIGIGKNVSLISLIYCGKTHVTI